MDLLQPIAWGWNLVQKDVTNVDSPDPAPITEATATPEPPTVQNPPAVQSPVESEPATAEEPLTVEAQEHNRNQHSFGIGRQSKKREKLLKIQMNPRQLKSQK